MGLASHIRDREYNKFDVNKFDETAIKTMPSNLPNDSFFVKNIASMFNPLSYPLLRYTKIEEILGDVEQAKYPNGLYFINESYIQFAITYPIDNHFKAELIENNILILASNDALALDSLNGIVRAGISDVFLELE